MQVTKLAHRIFMVDGKRYDLNAVAIRKSKPTLLCLECGTRFKGAGYAPKCRKCGSLDVEPD